MTRTEKWKDKRQEIKRKAEEQMQILRNIQKICRSIKVCGNCNFFLIDDCIFDELPKDWELESEKQ